MATYIDNIKIGSVTYTLALTPNKGDSNTPVYFDANGLPQACTSLDLNTSGNAATASCLTATSLTTTTETDAFFDSTLKYAKVSAAATSIGNDGMLISCGYSSSWGAQIWLDDGSGVPSMQIRNRSGTSTWHSWSPVLTSNNYSTYALPLSGGTLTGALNVGDKLRLWTDSEGGNIRITSGNNHTNYWEMDSYNGNLRLYTYKESDGAFISTTLEQETGYWSTAYRSIRTSYDGGNSLYAGWSNEVNFGGTSSTSSIYFGYRALDSKPIPTQFIFGGADGSAILTAKSLSNAGRSVSWINGRDSALVKFTSYNGYNAITSMKTTNGSWEMGVYSNDTMYFNYASDTNYSAGTNSTTQVSINSSGYLSAPRVYGAVWNDYAEYRICKDNFKPGQIVCENNDDTLSISTERLQPGAEIVSDTFGFAIGETDEAKCPIAVSGRVLAYPYEPRETFNAGDAVCAGPNGTVSKMTREEIREYPERIIGTVSAVPTYEAWGTGNVPVNGRIWIKVK